MRPALLAFVSARSVVGAHAAGRGVDLVCSRAQLLAENSLHRQQLAVCCAPRIAPQGKCGLRRFLGSVRRECLDHLLVLDERHLDRVLREYVAYFKEARPHPGLGSACSTQRPRHEPADAAARWWRVPFSAGIIMAIGAPLDRAAP